MKKEIVLNPGDEALESLNIEVELDHDRKVITLHMREFDSELLITFVTESMPSEFRIMVDDSLFEHVLPLYELVIALAGRHHAARLQHHVSGGVSIRLGDPGVLLRSRREETAAKLLKLLSEARIQARAINLDRDEEVNVLVTSKAPDTLISENSTASGIVFSDEWPVQVYLSYLGPYGTISRQRLLEENHMIWLPDENKAVWVRGEEAP